MNKRIVIIGNAGSDKSTLATQLQKELGIPLHHLDTHVFVNGNKTDQDEIIKVQEQLVKQDSWIIEGCSIKTLEIRYKRADLVIFLDIPRIHCLYRILKRCFTFDKKLGLSGCLRIPNWALLKYIWNFDKEKKPQIYEVKDKYPNIPFKARQKTDGP